MVHFSPSPYRPDQWQAINALGQTVDQQLQDCDVRLMMGGEPTFVSATDFQAAQWRIEALGEEKRAIATHLLHLLADEFAGDGALLHYGVGKLYPGEAFPRWSLGCYWREDGVPLWGDRAWLAEDGKDYGSTIADAETFIHALAKRLQISGNCIRPAWDEDQAKITGYVLPLLLVARDGNVGWSSCPWSLPGERLTLLPGNAALGLRLPLGDLPEITYLEQEALELGDRPDWFPLKPMPEAPPDSIRVALSLEVQDGVIRAFLPPFSRAGTFTQLVRAIADTATALKQLILLEGYGPPPNQGIHGFQITPDPGVIEANIHPAATWDELVQINSKLYAAARQCGLGMEKYALDGMRLSTGGGAHITLGGKTTEDSPLLRRPDLLRSLITYWQHHPSLSYLFSGLFVGPTSQSPRLDETRYGVMQELEIAFQALQPETEVHPAVIDHLLGHLLTDVTGNAHRSAFCIDKLFPVNHLRGQLGLLELRAFTMPPHEQMRMVQLLLVRAIALRCWQQPYLEPMVRWGTTLHDRFFLPHYLQADLHQVLQDLQEFGLPLDLDWFEPFFDFRFPSYGEMTLTSAEGNEFQLELRHALEQWPVLGDQMTSGGTSRTVDNSMERVQVILRGVSDPPASTGLSQRYQLLCNGKTVPLRITKPLTKALNDQRTEPSQTYVGGVRFRARQLTTVHHIALLPHAPLQFEVVDQAQGRSLGGCIYATAAPNGKPYKTYPSSAKEAAARVAERFQPFPPSPHPIHCPEPLIDPEHPMTLDLRRG
jgi:uncharacterized protein (DUF2126 family)